MQSGREIHRLPTATLDVHEHVSIVIAGEHVLRLMTSCAEASRYKLHVPYLAHHVSPRPACTQPYGEGRKFGILPAGLVKCICPMLISKDGSWQNGGLDHTQRGST